MTHQCNELCLSIPSTIPIPAPAHGTRLSSKIFKRLCKYNTMTLGTCSNFTYNMPVWCLKRHNVWLHSICSRLVAVVRPDHKTIKIRRIGQQLDALQPYENGPKTVNVFIVVWFCGNRLTECIRTLDQSGFNWIAFSASSLA